VGEGDAKAAGAGAAVAIRRAKGAADLAVVRGLMREYGAYLAANPTGANICLEGYEHEVEGLPAPYVVLLLAEVEGQAAGCVALKRLAHLEDAFELKRLWVRPGYRGLRLGRRLMQAAIDQAEQMGARGVYLDTVPAAMPEANRLYEAFGFAPVERYNDNPVADVVFFRLELPEGRTR
jgi:N-acetylglutamate synthase-like GNAT family acetyltransferase